MFESDDFDQVLSQFEFPDDVPIENQEVNPKSNMKSSPPTKENKLSLHTASDASSKSWIDSTLGNKITIPKLVPVGNDSDQNVRNIDSPKHSKRKIINSHFDKNTKRKFPGPAGLLTGHLDEAKDDSIGHMELLSQDIDFTQNHLRNDVFQSPLWLRLIQDIKSWNLNDIDQIKVIKQRAVAGHLRRRKAQTVTAFIETVDRSAVDPLIILRDTSGKIQCTLHRDAWSTFAPYIVSEYCALVLLKPTVLTTGSAFKKHYLNITLSNIYAVYSSTVLEDDVNLLPDGYIKICDDNLTVIKTEVTPQNFGTRLLSNKEADNEPSDLMDDLDNLFSEDLF